MFMGGVTTAAAIAALEDDIGRPSAWASAQFLGRTMDADVIDIQIEKRPGRTINQANATLATGQAITSNVRAALGSGDRHDAPTQFTTMPAVPHPDDCDLKPAGPWGSSANLLGHIERRIALEDADAGREQLWIRANDESIVTPAMLAVFAEFMPGAHATTRGGSGLDLTIRFVQHVPTTWILADTRLDATANGLYHAATDLYASDGTLVAIASQTGRLPEAPQVQ